jgi:putative Holliday junction resolvase
MTVEDDFNAFLRALPVSGALAGLDFGDKTIGIAVSDLRRQVATPLSTLRRVKFTEDAAALMALVTARGVAGLILGLPRNMDGSEGPRAQSARAFARNLERLTPLPITFWDERLSTVAAERALIAADTSRKRRAEVIDAVDENLDTTRCGGQSNCQDGEPCLTHELWFDLSNRIYDYLSNVSLQDLMDRKNLVAEVGCRTKKRDLAVERGRAGHTPVRA